MAQYDLTEQEWETLEAAHGDNVSSSWITGINYTGPAPHLLAFDLALIVAAREAAGGEVTPDAIREAVEVLGRPRPAGAVGNTVAWENVRCTKVE